MITSIEGAEQLEAKKRSHASRNFPLVLIPIAETEWGREWAVFVTLGSRAW